MQNFIVQKLFNSLSSDRGVSKRLNDPHDITNSSLFYLLLVIILFISFTGVAFADDAAVNASGKVTVTDTMVNPEILIQGDVGLVTVTVKNTGNSNVVINDAGLITKELTVLNSETYNSQRTIGGGNSMDFTFTIVANQPDGIYYPAFYLDYRDAGSLRYNIPIRIESPDISISGLQIPDTYLGNVKNQITLMLGNPKSVDMTGITITPRGEGIKVDQTSFFIGKLGAHNSSVTSFAITPTVPTNLTFDVNYTCGMNSHYSSFTLPIRFGLNKLAADPILNNLEVTSDTTGRKLSGDVSNGGLSDAYGVIVSLQNETQQDNPNLNYVIGTVQSNDFSTFELTLPESRDPVINLQVEYKDASGNPFTKTIPVNLDQITPPTSNQRFSGSGGYGGSPSGGTTGGSSRSGGGFGGPGNLFGSLGRGANTIPVTEIAVAIGGIIVLIVVWRIWRKRTKGKKITIKVK